MFTAALPPIPVALPLIPVALDPRQLLPQPCDLSLLFLNAGIAGILLRPGTLPWHPTVMPDPLEKYKSIILDLAHQETTPLNKYRTPYPPAASRLVTAKLVETESGPAARSRAASRRGSERPALNRQMLVSHRHNVTISSLARVWAVQEALRTH